ncbi:MAG: diaminopimelate epimerase [Clostridiales bacterium]|nr:diaminopimelate epimerase [Clostridiales bacterium]
MEFWKLQATGNDFILIDNRNNNIKDLSTLAKAVCHRRFGVGADGLIATQDSGLADIGMVYFNSDGSKAAMCGNGLRSFAKYVFDREIVTKEEFTVETGDGIKSVTILDHNEFKSTIRLGMGKAEDIKVMEVENYELIFMHLGVPHSVIFLDNTLDADGIIDLTEKLGPVIEKNSAFPEGTNVNLVQLKGKNSLFASTWERGAGRTWACGTGACASAVASLYRKIVDSDVEVEMLGGKVSIMVSNNQEVFLEGPAELICKGTLARKFL